MSGHIASPILIDNWEAWLIGRQLVVYLGHFGSIEKFASRWSHVSVCPLHQLIDIALIGRKLLQAPNSNLNGGFLPVFAIDCDLWAMIAISMGMTLILRAKQRSRWALSCQNDTDWALLILRKSPLRIT